MNNISLKININGRDFIQLLNLLKPYIKYVTLILKSTEISRNIETFLNRHQDSLIDSKKITKWPGTTLLEGYATLFSFSLNQKLWDEILDSQSFSYWRYPNALEDLSFYSFNDECILTSISDENDVFLDVNNELLSEIQMELSPLVVILKKTGNKLF